MDSALITEMLFKVIGGLGIFLLGMNNLTNGLQTVAGEKLRWLISKVTSNRFFAAAIGTIVTMIIQSSSITTVMVVGFVNTSLMTLTEAIGVIMGANIGTTFTGWILAIKIGHYGLPLLGIASLVMLFSKKDKVKFTAMALMGLGMIFFGLALMKSGFKPIRSMPEFIAWFHKFQATSYIGVLKCISAGAILTMIVQSSSATVGITMSLASTGIIPFETAAALVLGENIGTTITAFLASIGTTTNAKRAAYAHVIFNVLGVTWISIIFPFYLVILKKFLGFDPGMAQTVVENGKSIVTYPHIEVGIASVHTGFNVANTLFFLPLVNYLAKLLTKIVPEKKVIIPKLTKLDKRLIDTTAIALEQSKQEIINSINIANEMFSELEIVLKSGKTKGSKTIQKIFEKEEILDIIQKEITEFLTTLLSGEISIHESEELKRQLRYADEVESISDYIANILKLYLKAGDDDKSLSQTQINDILNLNNKVKTILNKIKNIIDSKDSDLAFSIQNEIGTVKHIFKEIRNKELSRLKEQQTDPILSLIFIDILNAFRKINAHILNITEEIAQ